MLENVSSSSTRDGELAGGFTHHDDEIKRWLTLKPAVGQSILEQQIPVAASAAAFCDAPNDSVPGEPKPAAGDPSWHQGWRLMLLQHRAISEKILRDTKERSSSL